MNKPAKTFLWMLVAGAVGGVIGGALAHGHQPTPRTLPTLLQWPPAMPLAVALICLFSVAWSIAAKNSAPAQSSESIWSRRLHLIVHMPGLTYRFLPAGPVLTVLGLTIEIAGILFAFWARGHLGRNWSGEVRIAADHQLIRSGPYKYLRHPIYTGVLAMYAGTMIVSGQIHALIATVIITVAYWRKLSLEEKVLRANFGAAWDDWHHDTWALVPLLF
jgi:protein-S-isoprenylcysteine O-methyltransferase Ste14